MILSFLPIDKINSLYKFIGIDKLSITADNWTIHNRSYGNILIESNSMIVEIVNDNFVQLFRGVEDETIKFDIKELTSQKDYENSVLPESLFTTTIFSKINPY